MDEELTITEKEVLSLIKAKKYYSRDDMAHKLGVCKGHISHIKTRLRKKGRIPKYGSGIFYEIL